MSKKGSSSRQYIEVQKGPISMECQYGSGFRREPEMTNEDIRNMQLRESGKTLTLHQPKR